MPAKSPEEIDAALGAAMVEQMKEDAGITPGAWRSWFEHGIAFDVAKEIEEASRGRVPISMWPKVHPKKLFHTRSQKSSTVVNDMTPDAKLNMSRANTKDPFVKACRAKKLTQNDVAKRLKIPASLLSMYRNKVRKIPRDRAEAIERMTGWPADGDHWPGGIVSAD